MIRYRKNFFFKYSLLLIFLLTFSVSIYASSLSFEFEEVAPCIFVHQGEHLDVDDTYHADIANIGFIVGE